MILEQVQREVLGVRRKLGNIQTLLDRVYTQALVCACLCAHIWGCTSLWPPLQAPVCTYTQAQVALHLGFSCIYFISVYAFLYEMKSSISLGSVPNGERGRWQACNRKLPTLWPA